jgi:hypothetical protein
MKTREELQTALENLQAEANRIIGYMAALNDMENPDEPEVEGGEEDG